MAPTGANVSVGGKGLLGSVGRVVADRATVVTHEEASRVLVVITHDVDRALVIPPGALVERISHLDEVTLPAADQCLSSAGRSVHPREDEGFGPATSCSICCVSALLVVMTVTLIARGPPPAYAFGASARAPAHHGKPEACPPLSTGLLSTFPDQVRIGEATRAEDTGAVALTETRRRGTSSGAAPTPRGKIAVEPARRGAELVVVAR